MVKVGDHVTSMICPGLFGEVTWVSDTMNVAKIEVGTPPTKIKTYCPKIMYICPDFWYVSNPESVK